MTPELLDIWLVKAQWRASSDIRPAVVIGAPTNGKVAVLLISAAVDLYNRTDHYLIEAQHPDFKSTGLKKTSFIAGDAAREFDTSALVKKLGRLDGSLAKDFSAWFG